MKRLLALLCAGLALSSLHAATDAEVAARSNALGVAGAFTNDGFKIRDGNFTGLLKQSQTAVVQVNLYAGNQYWFSVATADPATKVSVALYDETGKPLKFDPYADANTAAAGYAPETSGPCYVQIRDTTPAGGGSAEKPATFCLIYSYK